MIATNNGSFPWRATADGQGLLRALRGSPAGGRLSAEGRSLRDRVIRAAIGHQERAGLDLPSDGLVHDDPAAIMLGLEGVAPQERTGDTAVSAEHPVGLRVTREVGWTRPLVVEDYLFAAKGSGRPIKPILPGPYTLSLGATDEVYGEPMSLATALATALNVELRALQEAGATFIQIDEPALMAHPEAFPLFSRVWEVLGRGVGATLCLQLPAGALDRLYPAVTRLKRLGCLGVEAIGGAEGLQALQAAPLPDGMRLGLGLVDGRRAAVESPDDLVRAVRAIPGLPPLDRVLLGTATDLGGLPIESAASKLASLSQAARILERG